jgi:hypothetical protein
VKNVLKIKKEDNLLGLNFGIKAGKIGCVNMNKIQKLKKVVLVVDGIILKLGE